MKSIFKLTSIFISLSAVLLVSCGGGGGGGSNNTSTNSSPPVPSLSFSSSVETASVGMSYTLTWDAQNTAECSTSGSWSGAKALSGTVSYNAASVGDPTYSITCGNLTKSVTVKVLPEFTSVPDANFEEVLVTLNIDDQIDGQVKTENILLVRDLWISSTPDDYKSPYFFPNTQGGYFFGEYRILPVTNFFSDIRTPFSRGGKILDITGIENFRNLEVLSIDKQNFTSINLSNLVNLKWLALNQTPLNSLDLSSMGGLYFLGITETPLTTLDISRLTKLTQLEIHNYEPNTLPYTTTNGVQVVGMTNINLGNQPNLLRFYCMNNRLSSINLSANPKIQEFWGSKNLFQTLDFSGLFNLTYVILTGSSQLTDLNVKGIAQGGVPYRLYTDNSPNLTQIKVSSVQAIQDRIAQITASTPVGQTPALGLYWDSWTTLVNAP